MKKKIKTKPMITLTMLGDTSVGKTKISKMLLD